MTNSRVSLGVGLLLAGLVTPGAARAQDDQIIQQQMIQQVQMAQQMAQQQLQVQLQQQQIQQAMDQQQQALQASTQSTAVIPEHLQLGNQRFDASVSGFRAYLEGIKSRDPSLYGQLSPDAARLESREATAEAALAGGLVVGLASVIYGAASGDTCTQPSLSNPNFAAATQAWSACNEGNDSRLAIFSFLGVGAIVLGSAICYAKWPTHQELMDLVNKNNRLGKQKLQWQVGYDPTQRFAFSGATVSF
jgi:hypothetical protein